MHVCVRACVCTRVCFFPECAGGGTHVYVPWSRELRLGRRAASMEGVMPLPLAAAPADSEESEPVGERSAVVDVAPPPPPPQIIKDGCTVSGGGGLAAPSLPPTPLPEATAAPSAVAAAAPLSLRGGIKGFIDTRCCRGCGCA